MVSTTDSKQKAAPSRSTGWIIVAVGACLLAASICAGVLVVSLRGNDKASDAGLDTPVIVAERVPDLQENLASRVGLHRRVQPVLDAFPSGSACVVVDQPEGANVFAENPAVAFVPASTLKLATSSVALEVFGADHRFKTEVLQGADGRLYLRGGGDPTLATPEWIADHDDPARLATPLQTLADQLNARGVNTAGGFVADASYFDTNPHVDGWESRFIRDNIAPSVHALAVDRSGPDADPAVGAGRALGALTGNPNAPVTSGPTAADAEVVAGVESPPLGEIVAELNKNSDNFIAEVLVRHLGREDGGPGTTAAGTAAVTAELDELGVDVTAFEMRDGSGLHYGNRVPCTALVELMEAAQDRPWADAFSASLAIGGTDGTLEERDQPASVHAKTGTLREVSALAGHVDTEAGPLRFAILMSDAPNDLENWALQDRLVSELAAWPQR